MLVLRRNVNEKIMIGDDIEIMVVETRRDFVRLGIKAPRDLPVHREEVYKAIKKAGIEEKKQCPACGYTARNVREQGDHHLCPQYPFFQEEIDREREKKKKKATR